MKKYMVLCIIAMLSISCNGQVNKEQNIDTKDQKNNLVEKPEGSWKVDKEFDENGNLIRYDSIYSWSSNNKYNHLKGVDRDSLMQSFKSRFYSSFSGFKNQGFEDIFANDSLFSKQFFNADFFGSDFGKDFMDMDRITQQMIARQKQFLEKYQSEFIKPEEEDKN